LPVVFEILGKRCEIDERLLDRLAKALC